jgi:hypothetical protein
MAKGHVISQDHTEFYNYGIYKCNCYFIAQLCDPSSCIPYLDTHAVYQLVGHDCISFPMVTCI